MEVVSGIATFGVLALSLWELNATLAAARPRLARPRASADWRCPFCHHALDDGSERVRCRACGTRHHAACWGEHQGCSVFGCGALALRTVGDTPAEDRAPPADAGTPDGEPEVVALPAAAAADPVG